MFDIWQPVSELRQLCLTRPLPEAFLGSDGLVKSSLLKSMDELLWEHTLSSFSDCEAPPHELIKLTPAQKWLNISALQKAIRRGEGGRAIQFAKQGCQLDADHVFRRLAVCALEDVGLGNLLAVASCLAVLGDRRRRREVGEAEFAGYLAQTLAASPKSRLACDLLSLVEYNLGFKPLIVEWAKEPDHELAKRVSDEALPIEKRMLATWLLAGTHRFQSGVLPKSNYRPRAPLMEEMAKARMPLIVYYIADRGAARTSDALFCSYLQIWFLVKNESEFRLVQNGLPSSTMIGNFPAEAYDMHTREGRNAIRACEINFTDEFFRLGQRVGSLKNLVFRLEGGLLDSEISTDWSATISLNTCLLEVGAKTVENFNLMCRSTSSLFPLLNLNRQKFAK
ncbi:hypothetical protein [Sphingorhabdus sp. SMR4y]|uniref:hypothetical protein n=1 Tax=Sphingorhabdus sp. SMR4y TaxID=2584094 RepID=UPI000B60216B|nr:hypothetical protein [Sphingorhabdus sp. SMR4y]ASK88363.1 hypothetical protein SPHFLASMR4Y_01615 [Sphingorhabdus sp. SMR4y]